MRDFLKNQLLASAIVPSSLRVGVLRALGAVIGESNIDPFCFIGSGRFSLGSGSTIRYRSFLDPTAGIVIGKNVRVGTSTTIITASHTYGSTEATRTAWNPESDLKAPVIIEDNVWVGAGTIILPGVTVGCGTVIAAGSVVNRDCEPNSLYGGVPAKLIRALPT